MDNRKHVFDFYSVWAQGTALYVKWAAGQGISYTELSVLYALAAQGSATQKEICELYGLPKQTVNHCIRQYEKDNYIKLTASEQDRREKHIELTRAGELYCQNTLSSLYEIEDYISRNISPERFRQAAETRRLFNTLFEKEMERNQHK